MQAPHRLVVQAGWVKTEILLHLDFILYHHLYSTMAKASLHTKDEAVSMSAVPPCMEEGD